MSISNRNFGIANDLKVLTDRPKKRLQQLTRLRPIIFNRADGTRQRAHLSGAYAVNPGLNCVSHFFFAPVAAFAVN